MFKLLRNHHIVDNGIAFSRLFNQDTFYPAFLRDIKKAKKQLIIESPFISSKRLNFLLPVFRMMTSQGLKIIINTKPVEEQEPLLLTQAEGGIKALQQIGASVLLTGGHHRKLAIIDNEILWEGSLNILSQNDSCEVMRRIYSEQLAIQMINFIGISKFIG